MKRRISIRTMSLSLLTFVFLVLAGSSGLIGEPFPHHRDGIERTLRVFCLVVGLWLAWILFRRLWRTLDARPAGAALDPPQPSIDRLMRLQISVVEHLDGTFSNHTVETFVRMITDPALYRTRVTERIDLEERIVTQQIAIEYSLPTVGDTATGPRYILLFSPPKGQLVDNLKITDGSGKPLADLSFEESTELVAAGLRLLLQLAIQSGRSRRRPHWPIAPKMTEKQRALELILLEQLTKRGAVDHDEVAARVNSAFRRYRLDGEKESVQELRRYVAALSSAYPIVAVVPKDAISGGRTLLRYERTLIPAALSEPGFNFGWMRVLLGLKPNQVVVPVHLSATAGSFHLYINGPATKYVLDQNFRCRHCRQDVSRSWEPTEPGVNGCAHRTVAVPKGRRFTDIDRHYRVTPKLGQSFVHLYTRGFGAGRQERFKDLELFARFKEAPPGSRATAVVTALVSTFLLGIMGRLASTSGAPSMSLPGLALALPAAARPGSASPATVDLWSGRPCSPGCHKSSRHWYPQ